MGPWTALNIEPESDNEDVEYDNTKEIQIEEALKLYQTALKLHSQGSKYYDEALEAYNTLFESEIFKYPESRITLARLTTLSALDDFEDQGVVLSAEAPGGSDIAPSTLPQILYLSYKNRAAFELDRFLYQSRTSEGTARVAKETAQDTISTALGLLSSALDKDASDPDLWRQLAALSVSIGSLKLARFALESSSTYHDQEDTPLLDGPDLETLATKQELRKVLTNIEYDDSLSSETKRRSMLGDFTSGIDRPGVLPVAKPNVISFAIPASGLGVIPIPAKTWEAVGECILTTYERDLQMEGPMFETYILHTVSVSEEQSKTPMSPVLVTSESLSKRRFSKSSVPLAAPSVSETAEPQTSSPVLRTKKLETTVTMNQKGVSTLYEETLPGSNDKKVNSVVATDSKIPMKRDSDSAGLQDPPEGSTRSRSKRLRARAETLADDAPDPKILNRQHEEQLGVYSRADDWVFSVAYEIGCRFGCKSIDSAEALRDAFCAGGESASDQEAVSDPKRAALSDFKHILGTWDANRSNLLLYGTGSGASAVLIDDGSDSGFSSFMERSQADVRRSSAALPDLINQSLSQWLQSASENPRGLEQLALDWIRALLEPRDKALPEVQSLYTHSIWSTQLQDILNQVLVRFDHIIYASVSNWNSDELSNNDDSSSSVVFMAFVESIFELHIEIYSKMVAAESKADQPSRLAQKERLSRWAILTNEILTCCDNEELYSRSTKELDLRHLWAQVLYISLVESAARDHILLCYQDLRRMFEEEKESVYILPNNSVMPEVSLDALEEELSKEKTMDFFQSIFGVESTDPVTLIENLEPVLMQTFNHFQADQSSEDTNTVYSHIFETVDKETVSLVPNDQDQDSVSSGSGISPLIEFIKKATVQLKLSLWHQLKGAYNRIEYPGMKVVCNFRSMILILRELHGKPYASEKREDRVGNLVIWLRNLADLVSQTLDTIKSYAKALDCLAEENLQLAMEACSLVTRLFHIFALCEDSLRIGQTTPPANPGAASTYKSAMAFLREMQPKVWHLLYLIYREAFSQHYELAEATSDDLIEFIRAIHCSFGNREYCRVGRKVLMRFIKSELLRLDGPEEEIAQALYDLYGLKITQSPNSIWEHGCVGDTIDRTSALENVEYVVNQATSMTMKDLLKSDIRIAVEKMQAVIGIPRAGASTTQQSFNRRLVTAYLKSPILATGLSQALHGLESLTTMTIKTDYASIAKKKWFFLVGWIHLAKYRTTKRVGPDNSEDLDNAITFLKLDLDFDTSNWETWMRLAQAYDSKLDEEILWDANMINEKAEELSQLERQAIHCYEMAVSLAKQSADDTRETQLKLSDLYTDFANRLYSSTREPFSCRVFDVSGHERFINQYEKGTYQVPAYQDLSTVTVWKTCEWLYQKALDEKLEDDWFIWYMRGKCRWKLSHNSGKVHWSHAVEAFIKAVQQVPEKRDSRHPEKEPILEPHFKLLSTIHKLLRQGAISVSTRLWEVQLLICSSLLKASRY